MNKIYKNGTQYSGIIGTATRVNYDNTISGYDAYTVQDAIDKMALATEDAIGAAQEATEAAEEAVEYLEQQNVKKMYLVEDTLYVELQGYEPEEE